MKLSSVTEAIAAKLPALHFVTFAGPVCLGVLTIFAIVPGGTFASSPSHQYVLKHPKLESCRANYAKKVENVREHKKGKVIRASETFCVYVAPKEVPVKPAPPAPIGTVTTLKVATHACDFLDDGIINRCLYILTVSVTGTNGTPAPTLFPPPNLVFTNVGKPGESWTVPDPNSVEMFTQTESFENSTATALGSIPEKFITGAPGDAPWLVTATLAGSPTYSASSSGSQMLL